jgi:hypothetical protein
VIVVTDPKHPKKAGPNAKPMVSKFTAQGLRAVLAAVDLEKIKGDKHAMKAHAYVVGLIDYLEGPDYAALSAKRITNTKKYRAGRSLHKA